MNLQERIEIFSKITSYFTCYRPHPLICVYKTGLSHDILKHAANYLIRSLSFDGIDCCNLHHAMSEVRMAKYREYVCKAITPNGMIVPKNESILEFNLLAKSFYDIIGDMGFGNLIHSWNVPPNLRIKTGLYDPAHLQRKNASEHIHSDAWAGEKPNCGTAMLLLAGDTETNGVEFYTPPDDFSEEWLKTTDAGYLDKKDIIDRYKKVHIRAQPGDLILSDFATLHASMVPKENSKPRISIDSVFAYKCTENDQVTDWRGLHARAWEIKDIGRKTMLYTSASVEDQVDSKGGFKQATAIELCHIDSDDMRRGT